MLYYDINTRDCYGRIYVNDDDTSFNKSYYNIVKRTRLSESKHDTWECSCDNICNKTIIVPNDRRIFVFTQHIMVKNLLIFYFYYKKTQYFYI